MDPVFQRLGDVTIQRLEKPKDKVGQQIGGDTMEEEIKDEMNSQDAILEDSQGLKRNFENLAGPSNKRTKFDFKKIGDDTSQHSFSDAELSDFDSESEIETEDEMMMTKSQNSNQESAMSELETSTDFLEKLVDVPFPTEENQDQDSKPVEVKIETDDYEYDIKEKLKEMGEISFETVKKGDKPKKSEVTSENEVVVTPAKKSEDDLANERKMGVNLGGNLRRNIREVMDETKLDESTLAAQRQEMERLRRVQEQQRLLRDYQRQMQQERVISLLQGNVPKASTSGARIGSTVLVKLPNGQTKTMTKLIKKPFELVKVPKSAVPPHKSPKSLIAVKKGPGNLTPSVSIAPVMKRPPSQFQPQFSDTDSESEDGEMRLPIPKAKQKAPVQTIDISSDDDCIVVSESEGDPNDDENEDPGNSGLHTNDEFNQPDDQGRVVINVGHTEEEPDIYLAPQIARIIKPHQIGGVRFLFDNVIESVNRFEKSTGFGCILAHSMGLGKTLQVVCFSDIFLRHTPAKTILCIMPINTLQNWMAEFNMWLPTEEAAGNSPLTAHGEVRPRNFNLHVLNDSHKTLVARSKVIREWKTKGGVLLIGYEQYRLLSMRKHPKSRRKPHLQEPLDNDKNKALFDEVQEALVNPGADLVICDEGHRIKNSHASISQALKQMRTKRRVVLTGYPLQNNLMEYWCMVDFVRPNYLGTKTEFCNMFERPIQNGQCIDSTEADIKLMRYRAHVLHSLLLGFVQRRSHSVLQTALPQKEEYVLLVRMTPFQRTLYETFMNEVVRTQTVPNPLKAFAVCCKIWNHPDVLYYFLKKQDKGDAVDIDLEEVSSSTTTTVSTAETPVKAKRGPKKKAATAKNSGKPAASVTPYNSSGDATSKKGKNSKNNQNNQNNPVVPNQPENFNESSSQGYQGQPNPQNPNYPVKMEYDYSNNSNFGSNSNFGQNYNQNQSGSFRENQTNNQYQNEFPQSKPNYPMNEDFKFNPNQQGQNTQQSQGYSQNNQFSNQFQQGSSSFPQNQNYPQDTKFPNQGFQQGQQFPSTQQQSFTGNQPNTQNLENKPQNIYPQENFPQKHGQPQSFQATPQNVEGSQNSYQNNPQNIYGQSNFPQNQQKPTTPNQPNLQNLEGSQSGYQNNPQNMYTQGNFPQNQVKPSPQASQTIQPQGFAQPQPSQNLEGNQSGYQNNPQNTYSQGNFSQSQQKVTPQASQNTQPQGFPPNQSNLQTLEANQGGYQSNPQNMYAQGNFPQNQSKPKNFPVQANPQSLDGNQTNSYQNNPQGAYSQENFAQNRTFPQNHSFNNPANQESNFPQTQNKQGGFNTSQSSSTGNYDQAGFNQPNYNQKSGPNGSSTSNVDQGRGNYQSNYALSGQKNFQMNQPTNPSVYPQNQTSQPPYPTPPQTQTSQSQYPTPPPQTQNPLHTTPPHAQNITPPHQTTPVQGQSQNPQNSNVYSNPQTSYSQTGMQNSNMVHPQTTYHQNIPNPQQPSQHHNDPQSMGMHTQNPGNNSYPQNRGTQNIQPQNIGGQPQNIGAQPQNIGGQPQNIGGQPQHIGGQPQHVAGQIAGGQSQNVGGQPPNMGGQHPNVGGQPQSVVGQNSGGQSQNIVNLGNNPQNPIGHHQNIGGNPHHQNVAVGNNPQSSVGASSQQSSGYSVHSHSQSGSSTTPHNQSSSYPQQSPSFSSTGQSISQSSGQNFNNPQYPNSQTYDQTRSGPYQMPNAAPQNQSEYGSSSQQQNYPQSPSGFQGNSQNQTFSGNPQQTLPQTENSNYSGNNQQNYPGNSTNPTSQNQQFPGYQGSQNATQTSSNYSQNPNFPEMPNQPDNQQQKPFQSNTTPTQNNFPQQPQTQNQQFQPPANFQNYQNPNQQYWKQDPIKTENFGDFKPPFNQNFNQNQQWIKKEDKIMMGGICPSPVSIKSENSNDSKPKINIISNIKLSGGDAFDMKKISILSDIKLEPKKEFDEFKEEKLEIKENKPEVKPDTIDDDLKINADTPLPKIAAREDTGIPYDWAVELLKDYIPGIIENSGKMEILFCIIRESIALGDRLLVFSQSLITLDLIEQFLQMNQVPGESVNWAKNLSYYRLDGSTSALEREKLINEFNSNPKIYLFLVSTRAGSLGINLIGANRVVVLDASWNPCHDTQAVCRVYRYGQRKPCFVYRLVVDNCLEKKIYDRQINKQGMSDRVVDECNPDAHLTMKDVSTLCWDDKTEEGEEKDWSHTKDNYIDVVLQKVLVQYGKRLNKEPFQHESLLVDRKDKQLSQLEKRLAKKGYEREKQASRQPSYNVGAISRGHRPVASVRPMQQGQERPTRWIPAEHWQRQGMTAQEMTLPLDVVIPTNQPDKGNIVLKAGQKVLVLKSPKGVYMQLESGKIVAIKTAIKVRGKAEDDAAKAKSILPPAIKNNSAISVLPQKRVVKPFNPGVTKLSVKSIKQNVPNLVSRMQSVAKRVQTAKTKPYNLGQEIARAVSQPKSETESHPSSSDEEKSNQEKRHFNFSKEMTLSVEPKIKSAPPSRASSLERREALAEMGDDVPLPPVVASKAKNFRHQNFMKGTAKGASSASALERLERTTSSMMSKNKHTFQVSNESLDNITSTYPEDEKLSEASQHSAANQSAHSISSSSEPEVIPVDDAPYSSETEAHPSATTDPAKPDIPTPEYPYNYYGYGHMQPYPPPPAGYPAYPPQAPPYDMMGYPQQPPQYNYGMYPPQGYPPPPQAYPPQAPYDYGQPPVYPAYPAYPPQQYPPPPQGMYPPPGAPPPGAAPPAPGYDYSYGAVPAPPGPHGGAPPPTSAPYYPGH